jgi:hypothetical protein
MKQFILNPQNYIDVELFWKFLPPIYRQRVLPLSLSHDSIF